MATIIGTPYSPPSPPDTSSSATMSPLYPDRPIRPLPRRSLRARLSPEIAEQIPKPTMPKSNNSVFNVPYAEAMAQRNGAAIKNAIQEIDKALIEAQDDYEVEYKDGYRFKGNEIDSDDEEGMTMARRYEEYQRRIALPGRGDMNRASRGSEPMSQSVASSNDSIDGYDSFENTNNKKKRKIPTSGSLGNHHSSLSSSLSNEMANMILSGGRDAAISMDGSGEGAGQYYGSGSSAIPATAAGTGISGAGRGRYGRSGRRDASGRSPLGVSNGSVANAWQMGRLPGLRGGYAPMASVGNKATDTSTDHGIISAAIAEASSLPTTPSKGRENISLLEQQFMKRTPPPKTQFTFTCDSDTSKGMRWPGDQTSLQNGSHPPVPEATTHLARNQKGFSTQGTQTSPSMAAHQSQATGLNGAAQQPAPPLRKPRRSAAKRSAMAARERRLQQEYNNYHHPPREEDIWICEFCEYESIFGGPPEALVRQYEIKDRRERKRLAEKRRLLEKAKTKGRKGKKGNKNSTKNNATTQPQQNTAQHNHAQRCDQAAVHNHGTQSEEYYGDEYDDDPQAPVSAHSEIPTKIPQPVAQHYGQSPRVAQADGATNGRSG